MRKRILLACLMLLVTVSSLALANDPPHNDDSGVPCGECHGDVLFGTDPGAMGPAELKEAYNTMCAFKCHWETSGSYHANAGPKVDGHTSAVIRGDYTFTTSCIDCHHPHYQTPQFWYGRKYFGSEYRLFTGLAISVVPDNDPVRPRTVITYDPLSLTPKAGSEWDTTGPPDNEVEVGLAKLAEKTGAGRGAMLLPNTGSPYNSRIIESINTAANTITVKGTVTSIATAGFAIVYGQAIKRDIPFVSANGEPVIFLDKKGSKSFVNMSSPVGICQVCHTQTGHWKNDGTGKGIGVHVGMDSDTTCTECHKHSEGFKPSCDACHGYPPGTLVFNPGATGSATGGVHAEHTGSQQYKCEVCHYDSAGSGPTHNNGDLFITMGFVPPGTIPQGGAYDGQLSAYYDVNSTAPETSVSKNGNKTCSSLYCHGNYNGSGKNAVPVWDVAATGACGTCHGASNAEPPGHETSVNWDLPHVRHAYNGEDWSYQTWPREYSCTLCHEGIISGSGPGSYTISDIDKHVSGTVDWQFDAADSRLDENSTYSIESGTQPPTDGTVPRAFGTCTVYCHSNVQPDGGVGEPSHYDSPQWGGETTTCTGCHVVAYHSQGMATGSHVAHVQRHSFGVGATSPKMCAICHKWKPTASRTSCGQQCHDGDEKIYHVNGSVDVIFDSFAKTTAVYTGTPEPGDGYGTCQNTYCHGNFPGSGLNAEPAWGDTAAGACGTCHGSGSGSHSDHRKSPYNFSCAKCHSSVVAGSSSIINKSLHVSGLVDWQFDATDARLQNGSETYSVTSNTQPPTDGTTPRAYGSCDNIYCHSIVQTAEGQALTADTSDYKTPAWGTPITGCRGCHDGTPASGSHTSHVENGNHCSTCHYSFFTPTAICTPCHVLHGSELFAITTALHVNNEVNVNIQSTHGGTYNGTLAPGDGFGTCSGNYCHSSAQGLGDPTDPPVYAEPLWGNDFRASQVDHCSACHKSGGHLGNGADRLASGSHPKHLQFKYDQQATCEACHFEGSISQCNDCHARSVNHVNHEVNVAFNDDFPRNAAPDTSGLYTGDTLPGNAYGSCSELYCHSPGTRVAAPYDPPNDPDPVWGGSLAAQDCSDCHGGDRDSAAPLATGSHGAHVTSSSIDCSVCHQYTVDDSRNYNAAEYALQNYTLGQRYHADGKITIVFDESLVGADATYDGHSSWVEAPWRIPGDTPGSCESTYCHSDGKSLIDATMYARDNYPPGYPPYAYPPEWGNSGYDPQNDGAGDSNSCNNCHDDPPRYDSHRTHADSNFTCQNCHADTVDGTRAIISNSKHVNGVMDIAAGGRYYKGGVWTDVSFVYTPQEGGGECSSNNCHGAFSFTNPVNWANAPIPSSLNDPAVSWNQTDLAECSDVTESARSIQLDVSGFNHSLVQTPYILSIEDWGDGASEIFTNSTSFSVTHDYTSFPDRVFDIIWTLTDAEGTPIESGNSQATRIVVCPTTNTPPDFTWTAVTPCTEASGLPDYYPGTPQWDSPPFCVELTLTASDPDYNAGSHAGQAALRIEWGGYPFDDINNLGITEGMLDLTNVSSGHTYPFRYFSGNYYFIRVGIDDNAPEEGYLWKDWLDIGETDTRGINVSN